jgi:hypothetical protein
MNSSLTLQLKDLEYFEIPSIIPKKSDNINDEPVVVNKNIPRKNVVKVLVAPARRKFANKNINKRKKTDRKTKNNK